MTSEEYESFITLKFYPPQATASYVEQIPAPVRAEIFNQSNLADKGMEVDPGFLLLLRAYCTSDNGPTVFLNEFWKILKDALLSHYMKEEVTLFINLKFMPSQPTLEYVKSLPAAILEFLATSVSIASDNMSHEESTLNLIALMHRTKSSKEIFDIVLKAQLIEYYSENYEDRA